MTDTTQYHSQQQTDEIDLIDLLLSIWQQKVWVIALTLMGALSSITYSLLATEQWTSTAEIIMPTDYEIQRLNKHYLSYQQLADEISTDLKDTLYQYMMTELKSESTRVDFFKQSSLYEKLTQGMSSEQEKNSVLNALVKGAFAIKQPDNGESSTVSFSATMPEDAQQTLSQYIDYLSDRAIEIHRRSFSSKLDNRVNQVSFQVQKEEEISPKIHQITLEGKKKYLQQALDTAKAAGIKESMLSGLGDISKNGQDAASQSSLLTTLQASLWFLLGDKYLQAQLDNVDKTPLVYPTTYYYRKSQLEGLTVLRNSQKDYANDQVFRYQSSPSLPLQRDKPRRFLIVMIGTLVGGILGLFTALLVNAIRSHKLTSKS